jgi:hypothetical protein
MKLQGPQEMQASANSALSSSSIHFAVVAEKSAAKVHGMNKMLLHFYQDFGLRDGAKSSQLFGFRFLSAFDFTAHFYSSSYKQIVMNSSQPAGISKNRLPWAWQRHAKGSGGHQTCHYRRQVLAIEANSIRGRLGHYRTGFRRPSQGRRHRLLRPASSEPIAQSKQNASMAKQKIHEPKK